MDGAYAALQRALQTVGKGKYLVVDVLVDAMVGGRPRSGTDAVADVL